MATDRGLCCASTEPLGDRSSRTAILDRGQRELYRWIIEQLSHDGHLDSTRIEETAAALGVELEQTLETFAVLDLVHGADDEIAVAYPFSGWPTSHHVWIDDRKYPVFAMCAIDALGIAPMLSLPVEILSHDPVSGSEVWVRIDPGDGAWWEPETAVVLDACTSSGGPSFRSCCDVLNFFESGETALQYLIAHPDVSGHALSMPEAIDTGRAVFGNMLQED